MGLGACQPSEEASPTPLPPGTGGSSTIGPTQGGDSACQPFGDPDPPSTGSGSGGSSGGFKFDVGASDDGGVDFPVTCDDVADRRSNLGCEFWAVDLPNDWNGTSFSPAAAEQQFAVVVANASSLEPVVVSIYVGDGAAPVATEAIEVDTVHTFELDAMDIDPTMNSVDGVAYRIESDAPVTAYQFNPLDNTTPVYSNDASVLLPAHVMGMDYGALTSDGIWLGTSAGDSHPVKAGAFVSVVGLVDGTSVDILASGPLFPGDVEAVAVSRGQVFTVLSEVGKDDFANLTGTRIVSNKPVAVFSGNVAAVEPTLARKCCADHLEQQLLPIEAWGTAYAAAPPPAANGSGENDPAVYRIISAFDDTELVYCPSQPPGAPSQIRAFRSYKFESSRPFVVQSVDPAKPIAVAQFLESTDALTETEDSGDPAMLLLPPAAQFQAKYVFAVPAGYAAGNFVTVVTRGRASLALDGFAVDPADYREVGVLGGKTHYYVHLSVDSGAHLIEANAPVGISVIGYDEAVSYGYPGGAGLNVIAVPPAEG